ncbi:MAG: class I SAM-dependent methyltransferase [Planctomycetaceae bacterium]
MPTNSISQWSAWLLKMPRKLALAARSLVLPSAVAEPYRFDDARAYWTNVPRAQGSNPFNSRALGEISDEQLGDEFRREVEIARKKDERRIGYQRALESLDGISRPRVMDYGSGIGFYGYEVLCRRRDAHVTFVDINASNLAAIERILTLEKLVDRAAFCVVRDEAAEDLNFDEPFDLIVSMGVLHHTPHARRIVVRLTRFLKDAAIFQVMLYNRRYLREMQCVAGRKLNDATFGHMTDPPVSDLKNPFSEAYDDEKAKELFEGYDLVSADYPHKFYNTYRFRKRPSSDRCATP